MPYNATANTPFFTITGADFLMPAFVPLLGNIYIQGVNTSNNAIVRCELKDNVFTLVNSLGDGQRVEFNFEYFTKD